MRQEGQDSVGGDEAQGRGVPCSPRSPRPSQRLLSTGRSLRSCLISSRIFSCRVLCFWGKGRSLLSETCRGCGSTTLGASSLEALRALAGSVPRTNLPDAPKGWYLLQWRPGADEVQDEFMGIFLHSGRDVPVNLWERRRAARLRDRLLGLQPREGFPQPPLSGCGLQDLTSSFPCISDSLC